MRPSQNARVLEVLRDGRPHTMLEIHALAGFMRLNSRISELRSKGHRIECWREGPDYIYQLDVLGEASAVVGASPSASVPNPNSSLGSTDGDGADALTLFDTVAA